MGSRRFLQYVRLVLLLLLYSIGVLSIVATGGNDSTPPVIDKPKGVAPTIHELTVSTSALPLLVKGEQLTQTLKVIYEDLDLNITRITITTTNPDSTISTRSHVMTQTSASGAFLRNTMIDHEYPAGTYEISVQLSDDKGLVSNPETVSFNISASAPKALEITAFTPANGVAGDTLTLNGIGFDPEPGNNYVYFKNAIGSAEIISASETQLEVLVPDHALTGTIAVANNVGRTVSPDEFTVDSSIRLRPATTQIVTESTARLSCVTSGVANGQVHWLLNGEASPPASIGSIDFYGTYTAPAVVPVPNTVTVTCVSDEDAGLNATAEVRIVSSPLPTGQGHVTVGSGGEVKSVEMKKKKFSN
jgi:hypothetical protein